jgi:tetratricopeptide (TPR) repeat protein
MLASLVLATMASLAAAAPEKTATPPRAPATPRPTRPALKAPPVTPPRGVEAVSLSGEPLPSPTLAADLREKLEADLSAAWSRWQQNPDDPDNVIWVGRRLAYLGRYREAIDFFSSGIERFPSDARFLRHRGHRYITTRRLALAEADLATAAGMTRGQPDVVEPDGQPNARNIPTSTLQTNIWYHLGLARYLMADFSGAAEAYRAGLDAAKNPDMDVAMRYWLYHALMRAGRKADAAAILVPVDARMEIIENREYHRLLMLYKGEGKAEELLEAAGKSGGDAVSIGTAGYGVAAWWIEQGESKKALPLLQRVLRESSWASFGRIAAEAEIVRMPR